MTIADLIKRVEAATRPDREIDAAVGHALGVEGKPRNVYRRGHYSGGKPVLLRVSHDFLAYTASVDAVIRLIEEKMPGHRWLVRSDEEKGAFANLVPFGCRYEGEGVDHFPVYAPTPAIALLLAFLRAWEQRGDAPKHISIIRSGALWTDA